MIRTRNMTVKDLGAVLDWAAAEGWNPGLDDAEPFLAADPEGFLIAEENGEPAAAISVVNHGAEFAFLGLYLCRPSHRGRGIGYALWRQAMAHAEGRTVGLDGVPDQQANYAKSGFARAGATTRYSGTISGAEAGHVRRALPEDIAHLIKMEAGASGYEKPAYMSAWFENCETRETYVVEGADEIEGAVTVRRCRSGAKIGPLIAKDKAVALALLRRAALAFAPQVSVDVPAASTPLEHLCRELGLAPGFHTARMYRGPPPRAAADWYAVGTLELG